ncbi:hypothetical protein KGQ19_38680 [Catenulispora sp. NL8]|uniref:Uncharacterized protein n=1 Tax=Catenulispora pinistramenti TaxID=2705254 RepID=A0ABS5L3J4_9ACTN|nr:hypothetical protein [Catenulispora pinistramenti]MBS2552797.1 hypothetical protein [Catenulispora pinistramenti]
MQYIAIDDGSLSPQAYLAALPELAPNLPPGARAFATDPTHYDFYDRRCVKDLNLGPITHKIGSEAVDLEIRLTSSGLKHDEWLVLRYSDVSSLTLEVAPPDPEGGARFQSLALDEVLPHPDGCSHEIAFWDSSVRVVCRDLTAEWVTEAELARRS